MFRLNGDIIKQLNNLYGCSFKIKYKNELKERILFFIESYINDYSEDIFINKFQHLFKYFEFDQSGNIIAFNNNFIILKKEELFNFFNPNMYTISKKEYIYSKKELDNYLLYFFMNDKNSFLFYHIFFKLKIMSSNLTLQEEKQLKYLASKLELDNNLKKQLIKHINFKYLNLFSYYFKAYTYIDLDNEEIFKKTFDYYEEHLLNHGINLDRFLITIFSTSDHSYEVCEEYGLEEIDGTVSKLSIFNLSESIYFFYKKREELSLN